MRRRTTSALVAGVLLALAGCAPQAPGGPSAAPSSQGTDAPDSPTTDSPTTDAPTDALTDDGATVDDYCAAVHRTRNVTAETTPDGVVVRWDSQPSSDPVDFVVHRRAVGTQDWQRVAPVTVDEGAEMTYLDATPAEQPGTAYEYTVTRVESDCAGESPTCAYGVCDPAPSATPRQD